MTIATATYITVGILLKQWHQHIQEQSVPQYIRNSFVGIKNHRIRYVTPQQKPVLRIKGNNQTVWEGVCG